MIVVGAGIGGMVSALHLAARGFDVTVLEKNAVAGGKIRSLGPNDAGVDSGPTVFTMRWIFDAILAEIGERLDDHVTLKPAAILARHQWQDGAVFDLHADREAATAAVAELSGPAEAARYRAFCGRIAEVFAMLDRPFMQNPAPSMMGLTFASGLAGLAALPRIRAFSSLWQVAGQYFHDPRLRQLFGRYATYCGSSPFEAPGPLMLIAHVEQRGVWLVENGIQQLARMLQRLCERNGATFRFGAEIAEIAVRSGKVQGVVLTDGEMVPAQAVVFNGDPGALFGGMLGDSVRKSVRPWRQRDRSLSAVTLSMQAEARGFPLSRHTVFFSDAYKAEFDRIFEDRQLPDDPTIYVCAQDRGASATSIEPAGPERLFLLVNAPAAADAAPLSREEIDRCLETVTARLARAGLAISPVEGTLDVTTPNDFSALFPGSGGALYGRASRGWRASFQRPGARTTIPGLYLCGGSVHPGPGMPMAALSGVNAAQAVIRDLGSPTLFPQAATPGGMSTRRATTAPMR